jgi:hypothetical protein
MTSEIELSAHASVRPKYAGKKPRFVFAALPLRWPNGVDENQNSRRSELTLVDPRDEMSTALFRATADGLPTMLAYWG